jgi:hypothetical protein
MPSVFESAQDNSWRAHAFCGGLNMTESSRPTERPLPLAKGQAAPAVREPFSREELLARYRQQRALPEDPFEQEGRPTPPPGYREKIMSQPKPARFMEREPVTETSGSAAARKWKGLSLGQTFAVAAGMALAGGAAVGVVNATLFPHAAPSTVHPADPAPVQAGAVVTALPVTRTVQTTVIAKKPVPTATLEVSDAAGETNSFIPLALHAQPADLGSDILLKISGIPEGAYLTSGRMDEDKVWALTAAEIKNVRLVVPEAQEPKFDLAVAAFEQKTGELAAPVKTMTIALSDVVVEPASAPPPTQIAAAMTTGKSGHLALIPPPDAMSLAAHGPETSAVRSLVLAGDALLKAGDVAAARNSYEQAWAGGSPAGAYGLARSYDPVVLAGLPRKNAEPDKAKALDWYERAATGGHASAADSIVRLQLKR